MKLHIHWRLVALEVVMTTICLFGLVGTALAQVPDREPSPLSVAQIHSGHSLTDSAVYQVWPGHYALMIDYLSGGNDNVGISTIPGSPMHWRWDHSSGDPDAKNDIADWELLVITEGVPMGGSGSQADFQQWVQHAWENGNNGNGAPTLLYATWTGLEQGEAAWRAELDDYVSRWEAMADAGSAVVPDEAYVYIVPGNFLMMRLYDDIQAGVVPDVSSIRDFFRDDIHTSHLGSYALALMHIAVIHHVDPHNVPGTGWQLSPEPSPALTQYLQDIVWEIAQDYDRAGVPGGATPAPNTNTSDTDTSDDGNPSESNNTDTTTGPDNTDIEEDIPGVFNGGDEVVTTDNLNLRESPGGEVVKVLPKGTSCNIPKWNTLREKDGHKWAMVVTDDNSWGYVATDFLDHDNETDALAGLDTFSSIRMLIQQLLQQVEALQARINALQQSAADGGDDGDDDREDTVVPNTNTNDTTGDASTGVTLSEISQHDSSSDCWMAIGGTVYNLTNFIATGSHRPGMSYVINECGTDASSVFSQNHGGSEYNELYQQPVMGELSN